MEIVTDPTVINVHFTDKDRDETRKKINDAASDGQARIHSVDTADIKQQARREQGVDGEIQEIRDPYHQKGTVTDETVIFRDRRNDIADGIQDHNGEHQEIELVLKAGDTFAENGIKKTGAADQQRTDIENDMESVYPGHWGFSFPTGNACVKPSLFLMYSFRGSISRRH